MNAGVVWTRAQRTSNDFGHSPVEYPDMRILRRSSFLKSVGLSRFRPASRFLCQYIRLLLHGDAVDNIDTS